MNHEKNLLTPRMREYQKLIELTNDKEKCYELAMRFLVLTFKGSERRLKNYKEMARIFLEVSQGYSNSNVLLASFWGIPSSETRLTAMNEIAKFISEEGINVK